VPPMDLLLSSGFLAFARHIGVLRAIEARQVPIDGVFGTSSGALVGALWAAGHSSEAIEAELQTIRPISLMGGHWAVHRGLFSMGPVIAHLRGLLPARVEALPRPLGLGVQEPSGRFAWRTAGPLPELVAASCAMPLVFAPVEVEGLALRDGGAADRLGADPHRRLRGEGRRVLHRVRRSAGVDQPDDLRGDLLIESERSGATFWSLGDLGRQVAESRDRALAVFDALDGPGRPASSADR
jgi:predicted acylesterase/phospholipase RssA